MQMVMQSVIEILMESGHNALAYIDDMAGVERTREQANIAYNKCRDLLKELGLQEAPSKSTPPSKQMVWLGINFNTEDMTMSIPPEKLQQIHVQVAEWMGKRSCTN